MKTECHDYRGEINLLENVVIGEIVYCPDPSADLMLMITTTTTTKDKVEFKSSEKVDQNWGQ
jgi:hypothetical protein